MTIDSFEYPCTQCGMCCKQVGKVLENREVALSLLQDTPLGQHLADFPYQAAEDGSCEMLENNVCLVYDNRPSLCNINAFMQHMTTEQKVLHYLRNVDACNAMMDAADVDQSLRIDKDKVKVELHTLLTESA
jgi:Fe-S-cluster containining protein